LVYTEYLEHRGGNRRSKQNQRLRDSAARIHKSIKRKVWGAEVHIPVVLSLEDEQSDSDVDPLEEVDRRSQSTPVDHPAEVRQFKDSSM
jgi:hypothetical protein